MKNMRDYKLMISRIPKERNNDAENHKIKVFCRFLIDNKSEWSDDLSDGEQFDFDEWSIAKATLDSFRSIHSEYWFSILIVDPREDITILKVFDL